VTDIGPEATDAPVPDEPHQVLDETLAIGERLDLMAARVRRRLVIAGLIVLAVLASVVIAGVYEIATIQSNQADNHKTVSQTLEGLRAEYRVACGVAAHYGVHCPPFPTRTR
jgi:hypothetical protein